MSDLVEARRWDAPIDGLWSIALAVIAVSALGNTFGGAQYLIIGVVAATVGAGAAWLTAERKMGPLLSVLVLVAGFVVFSGVAVPDDSAGLPTPAALEAFWHGLTGGWAGIVTTAPPVGFVGGLGVVPYTLAFVASAVAMLLAARTRLTFVPVLPSCLALVTGFVFGTAMPVSEPAQGALFIAMAIGWGSVRSNRTRRSVDGTVHWARLGSAVAMLVVITGLAFVVGPPLPPVSNGERYYLRQHVLPPFDPRNEPSPLGAFRTYVVNDEAKQRVQFSVDNLPDGGRVRLATMDTYDGVVWVVGGPKAPASGRFERVGESVFPTPPGTPAEVTIEARTDREDVWSPSVGAMRSARFEGPNAAELTDSFRYNRTTQSGAAPTRLRSGDRIVLDVQLPAVRDDNALRSRGVESSADLSSMPALPEDVTKVASEMTAGATNPYEQAIKMEKTFNERGFFSNGGSQEVGTARASAPGHSLTRIQSFLSKGAKTGYVGNAEQYAATMAVLARSLRLPARVVMGFTPPKGASGKVDLRGDDVDAWVEIAFQGVGWVPFYPTPDKTKFPDELPQPKPKQVEIDQQVPPPPTYLQVPETIPELDTRRSPDTKKPDEVVDTPFELPVAVRVFLAVVVLPLLLLAAGLGLVVMLKRRRASRRRRRGPPEKRLAAAWDETCDRARDLGAVVPGKVTRREAAEVIGDTWDTAPPLARDIDAAMFGLIAPGEDRVDETWRVLDEAHRAKLADLDRVARAKARFGLASLRPGRTRQKAPAPEQPVDELV